jgi:hypothetical protein
MSRNYKVEPEEARRTAIDGLLKDADRILTEGIKVGKYFRCREAY